jgi:hypothetical protein
MRRLIALIIFIATTGVVAGFNHSAAQNQVVSDEWVKVNICKMSFLIPKDLKRTNAMGIDSCVAEFVSDNMRLYLDYGRYSSDMVRGPRDFDFKEQSMMIGGKTARVVTYNDETSGQGKLPFLKYFAHLYVTVKSGEGETERLPISLMMGVGGESQNDWEIALRIFRSLSFDEQNTEKLVEWTSRPIGSNNEHAAAGTQLFRQLDNIEIEEVSAEGKPIAIGQGFTASDDWLRSLAVRVKNVSGQPLLAIQVTLILPEMDHSSPDIVYCYGCAPAERAKGVSPGEVVELKMLGGGFYDWVKTRAADKGGISHISKAQIRDMRVTLADGTHWLSGCVKTADAKNACPRSPAP